MRNFRPQSLTCAIAGLLIAAGTASAADSTGATGSVIQIEINSTSSDSYVAYHGKVSISPGKNTQPTVYTWGGVQCPGKTISDEMVDVLMQAFQSRRHVHVTPRFKPGAGAHKCLVGLSIEEA